jgi:hypothetical protein
MVALLVLMITMVPLGYLVTNEVHQAASAKDSLAALGIAEKWVEILGTAQDPPPNLGSLAVDADKPLIPKLPSPPCVSNCSVPTETRGGTKFTIRAEYTWTGTQTGHTAPDLCSASGGAKVLNLQVTVYWGSDQQITDTTVLNYPAPGIPQYGFYQLQISGDSGTNDALGNPWSQSDGTGRVQAIPVKFTPPSPGSPVTIYPDQYGCVFAELSPTVSTPLTTALTLGQTGVTTLAVAALTAPIVAGESVEIGSGTNLQTVTASGSAIVGATSIPVTSFTSTFAQPVGTPVFPPYTVSVGNPVAGFPLSADNFGNPSFVQNLGTDGSPSEPTSPSNGTFGITAGVTNPLTTLYYDEGSTVGLSYPTSTFTADGVSCPGVGQITCLSEGEGTSGSLGATPPAATLALTSGSTWSSPTLPSSPSSTRIASVACGPASAACIGVGYGLTGTTPHGVILRDSTTTPGTVTADTIPASVTSLTNVICPSSTACVAWGTGTGGPVILAGTIGSTDTWNAVTLNTLVLTALTTINQIACAPNLNCVAVGSGTSLLGVLTAVSVSGPLYGASGAPSAGTWGATLVSISGLALASNLTQVACPTNAGCMAIGTGKVLLVGPTVPIVISGTIQLPLSPYFATIPVWLGDSFPLLGSTQSSISQLVCLSPSTVCLVVGIGTVGLAGPTQAVIYSGTVGSSLTLDSVVNTTLSISQVSCLYISPTSSTCVALGTKSTGPVILSGAIGSPDTWSPSASIPAGITSLSAVSCPNATICAVAASNTGSTVPAAAILYGTPGTNTTWSNASLPSVDAKTLYLTGISCTPTSGTSTCSAVGTTPTSSVIMMSTAGPGGAWSDHTADSGLTLTGSPTANLPIELTNGLLTNSNPLITGAWNPVPATPGGRANTTSIPDIFPFAGGYGVYAGDCVNEDLTSGAGSALAATIPGNTATSPSAATVPLGVLPIQVNSSGGTPESGDVLTLTATTAGTGCGADKYTLQPTGPDGLSRIEVPFGSYSLKVAVGSSSTTSTVVVAPGLVTVGGTVYTLPQTPVVTGP